MGLELFSGSGHMSQALRSQLKNVWCVEVDIALGPQFDLSVRRHQQEIIKLLFSKRIVYVWLGTPCNSWSRARRWDGKGPGPLRNDHEYIYGLPGLSQVDADKVRLGNNLMRFSAKVFRICLDLGIPVALENPYTSRLWLAPPIKHLLQHKLTDFCYTDFCQDNTAWRKRTGILFAHVSLRSAFKQCRGRAGFCSQSQCKHVQLCGSFQGKFLTLLAQPYPKGLCRRVARRFSNAHAQQQVSKIWNILSGQG